MTIEDQDAIYGRLSREREQLTREQGAIVAEIEAYADPLARLGGELTHDKHGALGTLNTLDFEKLKRLLKDYADVSSKLRDRNRQIAGMG